MSYVPPHLRAGRGRGDGGSGAGRSLADRSCPAERVPWAERQPPRARFADQPPRQQKSEAQSRNALRCLCCKPWSRGLFIPPREGQHGVEKGKRPLIPSVGHLCAGFFHANSWEAKVRLCLLSPHTRPICPPTVKQCLPWFERPPFRPLIIA